MTRKRRRPIWQLRTGRPVEVGEITLTPVSRRLLLRWTHGGFVWQYPVAVVVEQAGEETPQPIPDVTRTLWIALVGTTLLALLILAFVYGRKERTQHEIRSKTV